jgi:hypothetical protein
MRVTMPRDALTLRLRPAPGRRLLAVRLGVLAALAVLGARCSVLGSDEAARGPAPAAETAEDLSGLESAAPPPPPAVTPPGAGHRASSTAPPGAKGILKGNVPTFWLVLSSLAGIQEVRTENGQVALDPGSYTLMRWMAETKDAAGHRWQARGGMWPKPIEVAAGRVTPLRLASPLRAVLRGFYNTNPVSFRLEFSGSEGELYEGVTLDGLNPPMPHLKIADGKGKQIADLEFKPG